MRKGLAIFSLGIVVSSLIFLSKTKSKSECKPVEKTCKANCEIYNIKDHIKAEAMNITKECDDILRRM